MAAGLDSLEGREGMCRGRCQEAVSGLKEESVKRWRELSENIWRTGGGERRVRGVAGAGGRQRVAIQERLKDEEGEGSWEVEHFFEGFPERV